MSKSKFLDKVRDFIRSNHMAYNTEKIYLSWIKRFILFNHKKHPKEMGAKEIAEFLSHIVVEGNVAESTQNQAFSALIFLYTKYFNLDQIEIENVIRSKNQKLYQSF